MSLSRPPCAVRAVASVLLTIALAPGQKSPDVRLDTDSPGAAGSVGPLVAAEGHAVYVIWQDRRDNPACCAGDIYFSRSLDGGATWLPSDIRLNSVPASGLTGAYSPALAASGTSVYVAWQDSRNGADDVYFNRSLDGGTSWLPQDVRIDTNAAGATYSVRPQIAASGSMVYVAWQDGRGTADGIYFNRSADGGLTWSVQDVRISTIPPTATWSGDAQIAAVGSAVYVAWEKHFYAVGSTYAHFNRSLDGGITWLAQDVRLDSHSTSAISRDVQIDAEGASVHVVWRENSLVSASDVFFNRSPDGGTTWLPTAVRLDTDAPGSANSLRQVVAGSGGLVAVAWIDERIGGRLRPHVYVNRSIDGGVTWLPNDVRLDDSMSGAPAVAAEGAAIHVAAAAEGGGVLYQRSADAGATWLGALRLETVTTTAGEVQLATTGPAVHAVWWDERNGEADIYYNIPYGFQPYGTGTAGTGGIIPDLTATGSATRGSAPTLGILDGVGGAPAVMLVGNQAAVPLFGGVLHVAPLLALPLALGGATGVAGAGTATLPLPIHGPASILGANVNFQVLLLDPAASAGVSMTNAIELWIG